MINQFFIIIAKAMLIVIMIVLISYFFTRDAEKFFHTVFERFLVIFVLLSASLTITVIYVEEKAVTHIQEKYGTTYASNEYGSYLEPIQLDEHINYLDKLEQYAEKYDDGYFVQIKSNIYPEAEIYVLVNDIFGETTYRDNFLAYVYHDEAQQKIEEAISAVYSDFWMDFSVPSAVFDLDPETTGVKEYLSEDDADIKITLLAYDQEANDKNLDALVESFKKNGIAVECTVVFTSREQGEAAASEDALQTYMSKTGWYDDIAEFSIRSNGQLEYRKWRKRSC